MPELIVRPILGSPGAPLVADALAGTDETWMIHTGGEIGAFPAEAMTTAGTRFQRVVGLYLPIRRPDGPTRQIAVVLSPSDGLNLLTHAEHVLRWIHENPDAGKRRR